MRVINVKKGFITKVIKEFQGTFGVKFLNQGQARSLVEYSIAKFIIESDKPAYKDAKGNTTKVYKQKP